MAFTTASTASIRSSCRRAPCSLPPARAQRHLREGASGQLRARRQGAASSRDSPPCRPAPERFTLEPDPNGFFTSYARDGRFVSYYGDNHPRYNGNVVKAMASAKTATRRWSRSSPRSWRRSIRRSSRRATAPAQALVARLDDQLLARVERVNRLTPTIIEVIVRAPAAARHFHPGQFYRLQNFERGSVRVRTDDHVAALLMEGIALTGAWVDREAGPAVADHARDGRVEPAVRVPAAGRAGGGDGPDRDADRDPARTSRCCWPAAASATPCCSRSPGR